MDRDGFLPTKRNAPFHEQDSLAGGIETALLGY
jgi:hypothetical protein